MTEHAAGETPPANPTGPATTTPADGSTEESGTKVLTPLASGVAVALLVVYLISLAWVASERADPQWDRILIVLSGLEAIVFAGAGALFGTTIERKSSAAVAKDADKAKTEAETERARANEEAQKAQKGQMLAKLVKAKYNRQLAATEGAGDMGPLGARPVAPAGPPSEGIGDLEELAAMADHFFG